MKQHVQKLTVALGVGALVVSFASSVFAGEMRNEIKKEIRQEAKKEVKKMMIGRHAEVNGQVTAVSSNTLTVLRKEGTSVTVNVSDSTKLYLKFTGTAKLSNFVVGNVVAVSGKWANEEKTALDAAWIRNKSVSRKGSNFMGKITSIGSTSFVIQPNVRTNPQTVNVITETKYVDKKQNAITFADLKVGDEVAVNGNTWDRSSKMVNEAIKVVNKSMPR